MSEEKYIIEKVFHRLPIGTNNAYYHRDNRRYLKPEVKNWKEEIGLTFLDGKRDKLEEGKFGVEVFIDMEDNRKRDVDSGVKFILDALSGIIWKDDRQVVEVHLYKEHNCKENLTTISIWKL